MIPVIDLFAGPGGLGEGFSSFRANGRNPFKIVLSIEKDPEAHKTLQLRAFFRHFPRRKAPAAFYEHLRGRLSREELFNQFPIAAKSALQEAWHATLGMTPDSEVDTRIRAALGAAKKWILIGGPPCQAYSLVGRSRIKGESLEKYESDHRHFLYEQYLRILSVHKPPVFVMENVKGILSTNIGGGLIIKRILKDFADLGYTLFPFCNTIPDLFKAYLAPESYIIESEHFGIPQARHRVILLGIRNDVPSEYAPLLPGRDTVPMWKAVADLPPIRSRLTDRADTTDEWVEAIRPVRKNLKQAEKSFKSTVKKALRKLRRKSRGRNTGAEFIEWRKKPKYLPRWFADARIGGVCNHSARAHLGTDLQRYFFVACFGSHYSRSPLLADFPKSLLPDHKNVEKGVEGQMFRDRFKVQLKDRPATTIVSHISKDGHYFIHPDPAQCRSLTVREVARLQTFPDNYFFAGARTDQYRQVGNAVPPLLALQLAEIVYPLVRRKYKKRARNGPAIQGTAQLEHVKDQVRQHQA